MAILTDTATATSYSGYLKLDGIVGPADEDKMRINGFEWSVHLPRDASIGMATGTVQVTSVKVRRKIDCASNSLLTSLCNNTQIGSGQLELVEAGSDALMHVYLLAEFDNLRVVDVEWKNDSSEEDVEEILTLQFEHVAMTFERPGEPGPTNFDWTRKR